MAVTFSGVYSRGQILVLIFLFVWLFLEFVFLSKESSGQIVLWRGLYHSLAVHQKSRGNGFPLSPWRTGEPAGKASYQKRDRWPASEAAVALSFSLHSAGQINIFVFHYRVTVRCSLPTQKVYSTLSRGELCRCLRLAAEEGMELLSSRAAQHPSHCRPGEALPFPTLSVVFSQELKVV